MKKQGIVIFGSCVTRDAMEFRGLKDHLLYFHCRSNLASMASQKSLDYTPDISGVTPFVRRCVSRDFSKDFSTSFENCLVIFDFIDDRFPIASIDGADFTYNRPVSRINPKLYSGMTITNNFEECNWIMVDNIIKRFYSRFRDIFIKNETILHTANFNRFYDGSDASKEYTLNMAKYYDFLFSRLLYYIKFDHVIDCSHLICDARSTPDNHQWGHSPFHYCENYNQCLSENIEKIFYQ